MDHKIFGVNINLVLFSIIFGVVKFLQNFFDLIYTWISVTKPNAKFSSHIFAICLFVFIIPCSICLIVGALKSKRYLILVWLICSIMDMLSVFRIFALTAPSVFEILYRITELIVDGIAFYIIMKFYIILRDSKRTRHTVESWTVGNQDIVSEDVMT